MNRKLHNTILAFSVPGVMLFVGLIVAEPVIPVSPYSVGGPAASINGSEPRALEAISESLESRTRAFEARIENAADTSEASALAVGFLAASITEVALATALNDIADDVAAVEDIASNKEAKDQPPRASRRAARSRDLIAVPYFSFARGSRGSRS